MKRSGPPARRTPLKRGGRLRPQSPKRRGERDARANAIAAVIERDGPGCKAARSVPQITCAGPIDADEYDLRSARPGGHLDPANIQLLCRSHHEWKHAYPTEAALHGLRPFPHSADRTMP